MPENWEKYQSTHVTGEKYRTKQNNTYNTILNERASLIKIQVPSFFVYTLQDTPNKNVIKHFNVQSSLLFLLGCLACNLRRSWQLLLPTIFIEGKGDGAMNFDGAFLHVWMKGLWRKKKCKCSQLLWSFLELVWPLYETKRQSSKTYIRQNNCARIYYDIIIQSTNRQRCGRHSNFPTGSTFHFRTIAYLKTTGAHSPKTSK